MIAKHTGGIPSLRQSVADEDIIEVATGRQLEQQE